MPVESDMQKSIIASLDESLLETKTADSDRFVLCNYVMPLLITYADDVTPLLPGYKRAQLNAFARTGVLDGQRMLEAISALDVGEVVARNHLELAAPIRPAAVRASEILTGPASAGNPAGAARRGAATEPPEGIVTPHSAK